MHCMKWRIHSMSLLVYDFSATSSIQWPTIFLMTCSSTPAFFAVVTNGTRPSWGRCRGPRPKAFTTNALPFLCVFWLATQRYHRTIYSSWMWRNHTIIRCFIKRINKEYLHVLILNQSAAMAENDYTCRFQSTYTNCICFLFAERGWMCYNQNSFLRCIFRR